MSKDAFVHSLTHSFIKLLQSTYWEEARLMERKCLETGNPVGVLAVILIS